MINVWEFIRAHFYLFLLYIVGIVIVCFLFPREGRFPYEFQQGKTWGHDDLYAPFDFPIFKTQQEIDAEKDSLQKTFVTYYNERPEVVVQQKRLFTQTFNEQAPTVELRENDRRRLYQAVTSMLDYVYSRGIFQADDNAGNQSLSNRISIIKNNISHEGDINDILSPKAAYELVTANLERETSHEEFLLLRRLNLNNFIQPNLTINANITNEKRNEQINRMSYTKSAISKDVLIIERGGLVNDEKFNILMSYRREFEDRVSISGNFKQVRIGQAIVVVFCFLLVFIYLMYFRPEIFTDLRRTGFLLLIKLLFISLSCIVVRNEYFNLYVLPYVFMPLILCTFYDARIANFIYWTTILLIGFIAPNGFEFIFLNFVAGFISVINVKSIYRRGALFKTISLVILAYCVVYSAMVLMQGIHILRIDWMNFVRFAISGALVFVAYPSIFFFEKAFGFISDITLMELSDTNQPLLRKLSEKTPGTFQHTLQVANLSEEVIRKIGGNPLLVRTGALYHDLGKTNRPEFFTENQTGNHNPHESLTPEESAGYIIEHVTKGIEIARKNGIPQHIIDFIPTHHGKSIVRYFYTQQQKLQPDVPVDRAKFTYPGPAPFSKEMVVLMMCDSIEAASRSLKEISQKTISELVDNIVNYQIKEEQYIDANITYREINTAKQIIKNRLMNIYHVRIEYPKLKNEE